VNLLYLAALAGALGSMALLDRRYRLFFWRSPVRAASVLGIGLAFFVAWDAFGIAFGIFARGETDFMSGIVIAPEFPLEELFFLTFLGYLTMVILMGARRILDSRKQA
jgi:lycopene cyclase domain-containing protein